MSRGTMVAIILVAVLAGTFIHPLLFLIGLAVLLSRHSEAGCDL